MTKIEYIKARLEEKKFRADLESVVTSADSLIPENESDFSKLGKFGLYPADKCVPFETNQKKPFYELDNMAMSPIKDPSTWLHYGDYTFRQIEILYIMARMDSAEAHEWLRDNLFQGCRVDAKKKRQYKCRFKGLQRADWKEIQNEWMKYCLNLKYRDNALFRKVLHSTDKFPVEDATDTNYASNRYWGAELIEFRGRRYYFGCNVLGKLLAELRKNKGKLQYTLPQDLHIFGKPVLDL